MRITLLAIGKTDSSALEGLIKDYAQRITHYLPFDLELIPDVKRSSKITPEAQKEAEGRELLRRLASSDKLYLFDERGVMHTSREFAGFLQSRMLAGEKRIVLAIGGPYGFSLEVYDRAVGKLSCSKMTFSHQMIRLFATEQIYRAMTILKGEPYHHD